VDVSINAGTPEFLALNFASAASLASRLVLLVNLTTRGGHRGAEPGGCEPFDEARQIRDCGSAPLAGALGVVIAQADVCWADLPEPVGSGVPAARTCGPGRRLQPEPRGVRRVCPAHQQPQMERGPGNVVIRARSTGQSKDSVANVSQIVALDRGLLLERIGRASKKQLGLVFAGLDLVMGR
jgi:mRNA interferase MazF